MRGMLRLPSLCHICHRWPSQPLCEPCITTYAQPVPRCPTCALHVQRLPCRNCQHMPSPLHQCLAAVSYDFPWSQCISRFKFQADPGLAHALAQLMRHTPWVEPALDAATWVVPMPLSPTRLRERGFNQALELARRLAPSKTLATALQRQDRGPHQVGASRQQRLHQAAQAFWVNPSHMASLRGLNIVLVDDVMTTGATLYAAARALKAVGVARVTGLVLARTEVREDTA
jgi:ComF family protein